MNIDERYVWAITKLKEQVENKAYGYVMFNLQDGVIANVKTEITEKPLADLRKSV